MEEIVRTNNPVSINFIQSLLKDAGIPSTVLDEHTSILEGSIGILPRRIMVCSHDVRQARRIIKDANIDGISD